MHFNGQAVNAEWSPHIPKRLNKKQWRAYEAGRDAFLFEVAKITGPVLCVELQ